MNGLISRHRLFDDFFKDVAPGFYVKPLLGDPLPTQIYDSGELRLTLPKKAAPAGQRLTIE